MADMFPPSLTCVVSLDVPAAALRAFVRTALFLAHGGRDVRSKSNSDLSIGWI